MRKRIFRVLLILLTLLVIVLLVNTYRFSSVQVQVPPIKKIAISDSAVIHLSRSVQIPTNSFQDTTRFDSAAFRSFISYLEQTYPAAHHTLKKEAVNTFGLLYKWEGKNPSLEPVVLMAHYDVVPVEAASEKEWTEKPYSGLVKDGFIWGRGTMDDKLSVIGILEAVEMLINSGHVPERSVYLAFGHDEEIGGIKGAKAIVGLLKSRKIRASMVLDEGYLVARGLVPGIEQDVAMIGIAEKGFMSVELSVDMEGGHSSMPAKETAVEVLARAVVKLRDGQLEKRISEPIEGFFEAVGPEMPFFNKMVIANRWLFSSVILNMYAKTPSGNALVRTTTAPTIFHSGVKDNVLPTKATAVLNFRILPGETTESVKEHIIEVADDDRIKMRVLLFFSEPSPVSSTSGDSYKAIEKTIRELYPSALVAPNLVIGATDSRYFSEISDNVYRFLPIIANSKDLERLHGIDERISIEDFKNSIRFYHRLLLNSTGKTN